ncbi:e814ae15-6b5f-4d11-af72-3b0ae18b905b [Sclerotinia trifoliorum]|uniref:E814ae15-6b5f-4d11-af72-3b0ae18b905b n=1 Tax=Sclerotinia trifoliorum TaxID=28548 RepID=A0A8H2W2U6_9HELO|nr:e814ae15-6b5f-4d11-af72-3b0ae18b905b [Sclerotinia trifoliorum]
MASIKDQPRSSANQKQGKREPVSIEQLCVGCIVWMPEQDSAKSARCIMPLCPCNHSELDENGSEHHLVILDIFKTDKDVRCHVGKVTSKVSKAKHFTARIKIHQESLASSTEQGDLDNGLYLETGELRKQSHVSLGHVYEVSASLFSTKKGVPAYDRRLSEQSYYHLLKLMGLEAATYERTKDVEEKGATTRSWIAETHAKISHSETLEARVIDLPNVSSTIGTAQRMAAFNSPVRPLPLNSQNRPSSPPQDSPTSQSSVSTASLQSPIYETPSYESPIYEQHSPHRRPISSRRGSVHSQMAHLSHSASTTTLRSSLISPGHDTRFAMADADARRQEALRQRAREEDDADTRRQDALRQRAREEDDADTRRQDALRQRAREEEDAAERDFIEKERQRVREEVAERERQRQQREIAEMEYQRQQEEAIERERQRIREEVLEREHQRQQQEEAKRERIRRNLEALEQEHQRVEKEAQEQERQRLHAEYLEKERQHKSRASLEAEHRIQKEHRRRSRDSVSTECEVRREAAMATRHYLEKMATMEQEHPPRKEGVPPHLRPGGATVERDYSRQTESTLQSEHGRTQTQRMGSGSSTTSGTWSSDYSRYSKYTRISEYTNTRITEYTRYTSEVVMHGVENAPWRAMSVGSVVVVCCYSYYSGSYEVGFEAAKGLAGSLRAVAGMASRVLVKAGKSLTRLRR